MDSKSKQDCKYWDKCYQKNEFHLRAFNHPNPSTTEEKEETAEDKNPSTVPDHDETESAQETTHQETTTAEKDAESDKNQQKSTRKRRSSEAVPEGGNEDDNIVVRKNWAKRLWDHSETNEQKNESSSTFIHEKFLVKMPKDFYLFWKFVTSCQTPLRNFNIELVGPYDFLAGKFANVRNKSPGDYLRHWRFYYDPPEFQTLFVKRGSGIHYGYWRDDPKDEENLLIVRNDPSKGYVFELVATNMFDAFAYYLEKDFPITPFNHKQLAEIRNAVSTFVQVNNFDRKSLVEAKSDRARKICTKSFHNVGIVVPVDRATTVGYRPLIDSDAKLKNILSILEKADEDSKQAAKERVMEKLQPFITASVIALDECDFGTNLELGIDLFCSGHEELHELIQNLLNPAYKLLGRPQYMAILKAHLDDRSRSYKLSILN